MPSIECFGYFSSISQTFSFAFENDILAFLSRLKCFFSSVRRRLFVRDDVSFRIYNVALHLKSFSFFALARSSSVGRTFPEPEARAVVVRAGHEARPGRRVRDRADEHIVTERQQFLSFGVAGVPATQTDRLLVGEQH